MTEPFFFHQHIQRRVHLRWVFILQQNVYYYFINGKYDFVFSLFKERKKRLFKSIEDKWRARSIAYERGTSFRCSHRLVDIRNWKNFSQSVSPGIHKYDFWKHKPIKVGPQISMVPKKCGSFIFIISPIVCTHQSKQKSKNHTNADLLFTIMWSLELYRPLEARYVLINLMVWSNGATWLFIFSIFFLVDKLFHAFGAYTQFSTLNYVFHSIILVAQPTDSDCLGKFIRWHLTLTRSGI